MLRHCSPSTFALDLSFILKAFGNWWTIQRVKEQRRGKSELISFKLTIVFSQPMNTISGPLNNRTINNKTLISSNI